MEEGEDYLFINDVRMSVAMETPYDDLMNLCQTDKFYKQLCTDKWFWLNKVANLTNKREVFDDSVLRARVEYFRVFVKNELFDESDNLISFHDDVGKTDIKVWLYIIEQLRTDTENWGKYFEMLKMMIKKGETEGNKVSYINDFGLVFNTTLKKVLKRERIHTKKLEDMVYLHEISKKIFYGLGPKVFGVNAAKTLTSEAISNFKFLALLSGGSWIGYCQKAFKNNRLGYPFFVWLFSKPTFTYGHVDIDPNGDIAKRMKRMADEGPFILTNKTYRKFNFMLNLSKNKLKHIISSGIFDLTWRNNYLLSIATGITKDLLLTDPRVYTLSIGGTLEPFSAVVVKNTKTTTTTTVTTAAKARKPPVRIKQIKETEVTRSKIGQVVHNYLLNPYGTMEEFYDAMDIKKGDSLKLKLVWYTEDGTERVLYLNDRTLEDIQFLKNSELVGTKTDSPIQEYAKDFILEPVDDLRVYVLDY